MKSPLPYCERSCILVLLLGLQLLLGALSYSFALSPITSSGLQTQVSAPTTLSSGQTQYTITGGTRAGTNLFHSFGDFNVPTNNIANFFNDAGLTTGNILGRVTGGNPSSIFGTIQTSGFGNANLFLMNPAGIVFGPNATLNVGGSVTFTTANYLRLADTGIFHADPTLNSVLTSAPVVAFGFLGSNPAAIAVEGSILEVQPVQSISLVGGNNGFTYTNPDTAETASISGGIAITGGKLLAPGGQIQLASVASPGEILAGNLQPAPNINGQSFTSMGTISLTQGATLDVTNNAFTGDGRGGTIQIRGGQLLLDGSFMTASTMGDVDGAANAIIIDAQDTITLSNSSMISSLAFAGGRSGDITATTTNLTMTDGSLIVTASFGSGNAGNISLNTGALNLTNASIQSLAFADGRGGDIGVTANTVAIRDGGFLSTETFGSGSAGNVTMTVGSLTLDGGQVYTGAGDGGSAGNIAITATDAVSLSAGNSFSRIANTSTGDGATGNITLQVGSLDVSSNSSVEIQSFGNTTGRLAIDSSGPIALSGVISNIGFGPTLTTAGPIDITAPSMMVSSGAIETQISGQGRASDITLRVGNLTVTGNSRIDSTTTGPGRGGDIRVISDAVSISGTGSGIFSDVQPGATGRGGDIQVQALKVELSNGATISSKTAGSGNAGNILVKANDFGMSSGATITAASTGSGNAGTVTIEGTNSPANSVVIDGAGTGIFTDTQSSGTGGGITINTKTLTIQNSGTISAATSGMDKAAVGGDIIVAASQSVDLRNNASISARSTGNADAGNITINAGRRFESRDSSVTTKAENAGGGNIEINATDQIRLVNSQINASAYLNGGNISIDPNLVILQNSQILAQAIQGNGGNIAIFTPLFLADSSSLVSASSQFGLNGTVTIQSPTSNLSGSLGTLASKPRQAQNLLTQRCAALANGQSSSFVVAGREQLPADPGGWLSSPLAFAGIDAERFGYGTVAEGTSHLEPRTSGLLANDRVSLRRLTPAGFLIANFAESEATGCHS